MSDAADDPLLEAEQAFQRGDYAMTRALTMPLRASSDVAIRARAEELFRRTTPDAVQLALIGASFALFCFLTYHYVL